MLNRYRTIRLGFTRLLVVALCVPCLSYASTTPRHPVRVWATYGVGAGSMAYAGTLGVSFQTGHDLFTARVAGTGVPFFGVGMGDIGLLYGRSSADRYTNASISAGLSCASGRVHGRDIRTIGVPVEASVTLLPCAYVGIGVGVFGNLNLTLPFCGGVIFLRLGKLR